MPDKTDVIPSAVALSLPPHLQPQWDAFKEMLAALLEVVPVHNTQEYMQVAQTAALLIGGGGGGGGPGLPGPTGPAGPAGPTGPAPNLTVGSTTTGATANVSITGTSPNYVLHFVIPSGGGPTLSAPVFTSSNTANATEGTHFSYTIAATGNPAPTFDHTGTLPAWLTRAGAVISGTPPTGSAPGPVTFTVRATNSEGAPTMVVSVHIAAGTTPGAWEVTHDWTSGPAFVNAQIPLSSFPGWSSANDASMSDDLYNVASQAAMPVRLFVTWAQMWTPPPPWPEIEIPFDNWTNPTPGPGPADQGGTGGNARQWGYNSATHSITLTGSNGTGQPLHLRLVHA